MPEDSADIDTHVHTIASGHALSTIAELLSEAARRGLDLVCITDHGPTMRGAPQVGYFEVLPEMPLRIGGVTCLAGCECNIIDHAGGLDIPMPVLSRLDVVLAGLHEFTHYPSGSSPAKNTSAIVGAMATGIVDVIAHPVCEQFPVDIEAVVAAAADHACLLEVNCRVLARQSPDAKRVVDAYSEMLQVCVEYGVQVVVGSDAHMASQLADFTALAALEDARRTALSTAQVSAGEAFLEILRQWRDRPRLRAQRALGPACSFLLLARLVPETSIPLSVLGGCSFRRQMISYHPRRDGVR